MHELIAILEKFSKDTTINVNQAGFGSYIANYVIKEKIQRYNNEAMIPPKLGDAWIPKIRWYHGLIIIPMNLFFNNIVRNIRTKTSLINIDSGICSKFF